mmetsp:Transcript_4315/g.6897  ORF Transcript_4315/g.6897 Transcript_4315/m.6897 type:complete len:140 (+) Transcript_4315:644-1063(+)
MGVGCPPFRRWRIFISSSEKDCIVTKLIPPPEREKSETTSIQPACKRQCKPCSFAPDSTGTDVDPYRLRLFKKKLDVASRETSLLNKEIRLRGGWPCRRAGGCSGYGLTQHLLMNNKLSLVDSSEGIDLDGFHLHGFFS